MFVLDMLCQIFILLINCITSQVSEASFLIFANILQNLDSRNVVCFLSPQLLERTNSGFEESDSGATKSPLHLAVSEMPWEASPVTKRT